MYWFLRTRGKTVTVFNHDAVPDKFSFLADTDTMTTTRPNERFDCCIILDCSNPERLGWTGYETIAPHSVNIDHHRDNSMFAHVNIVDTSAAATAQIIFRLFRQANVLFPPAVAEALYTAIMTDTGAFRFTNTNGEILRICAECADRGADCAAVYRRVYSRYSANGIMLRAHILSTLEFLVDNRICLISMPYSLIDDLGAAYGDSEGMVDYTMLARGVVVGMFLKYSESETHVSLRSANGIDVGAIAHKVAGGGGHNNAAGCTLPLPYPEARELIVNLVKKSIIEVLPKTTYA